MKSFTPKIGIMAIVLILVFSAVILVANRNEHTSTTSSASGTPLSSTSTLAAKAQNQGNIGDFYESSQGATTASSSASPKADIRQYIYTGATVKSSNAKRLELESTKSPSAITDWYKNKIQELQFNAKSVSQTSTNDNILNKLTAAKPGEKLDITIKKDQTSTKTLITVDRP